MHAALSQGLLCLLCSGHLTLSALEFVEDRDDGGDDGLELAPGDQHHVRGGNMKSLLGLHLSDKAVSLGLDPACQNIGTLLGRSHLVHGDGGPGGR